MTFSVEDDKGIKLRKASQNREIINKQNKEDVDNKDNNGKDINSVGSNLDQKLGSVNINRNKRGVSIDVTKALVLLGFDSWSSLEPGNYTDGVVKVFRNKSYYDHLLIYNASKLLFF